MATPSTATPWPETMDPVEEMEWIAPFWLLLEEYEQVESYELELSPEAIEAGVIIMTGDGRDHHLITGRPDMRDNTAVMLWLKVTEAMQQDPMFDGGGTAFPVRGRIRTNSVPSRKRKKTYLIRIVQK
ncbi:hypothetical protein GG804_14230 [Sphingomonas histidinilytica]|uniref:hypothetical protein n=1 Tax=Rhizorhabdus histidinilytica TaxID=439228 RepID=UPI001AD973B9|nr:hypothetical protein [Rhizorhabdus histidinilytica]MBO9377928.1 hypothetical protein [Rhizorhabdus histidinilytica]